MLCCHLKLCKDGSSHIKCSYPHTQHTSHKETFEVINLCLLPWLWWWSHQCMPVSKLTNSYTSHLCSFCTSIKLFLKRKEKKTPAGCKRGSYIRFGEGLEQKKKETSSTRLLILYKCPCALNQGTSEKLSMPVPLQLVTAPQVSCLGVSVEASSGEVEKPLSPVTENNFWPHLLQM